jgi:hypothetical protein
MLGNSHVRFGGGLGEKEHSYLARSLPYTFHVSARVG